MPFYEYICCDVDKGCGYCVGVFEVQQMMADEAIKECPKCSLPVQKLISRIGGILDKNKQPNQYPEVLRAKYWRDKNGVRHKVTAADGYAKAPTSTSKQYNSPEKIEALKKRDKTNSRKRKNNWSHKRFIRRQEGK